VLTAVRKQAPEPPGSSSSCAPACAGSRSIVWLGSCQHSCRTRAWCAFSVAPRRPKSRVIWS